MAELTEMEKLNGLTEVMAMLEIIKMNKKQAQDGILPDDIKKLMLDIDAEFDPKIIQIEKTIEKMKSTIKENILSGIKQSIKNDHMRAEYVKPSVSWNDAKLLDLAQRLSKRYPQLSAEIMQARESGKATVRFVKIG